MVKRKFIFKYNFSIYIYNKIFSELGYTAHVQSFYVHYVRKKSIDFNGQQFCTLHCMLSSPTLRSYTNNLQK